MLEIKGDILSDKIISKADAICFTSNGVVKSNGALVMGAGVAKAFRDRFPGIDKRAGSIVKLHGNNCNVIGRAKSNNDKFATIIAFPTKHHWRNQSDLELIKASAYRLVHLIERYDWSNVYLPKPGCFNGGLKWKDVKEELENILDDRVTIISL